MKCPLSSNQYGNLPECKGSNCTFADEVGDCLVKQALQCYVNAERTRAAKEEDSYKQAERWKAIFSK